MADKWILTSNKAQRLIAGLQKRRNILFNSAYHDERYSLSVYLDENNNSVGWHFMENTNGCKSKDHAQQMCLCLQANDDGTYTLTRHLYLTCPYNPDHYRMKIIVV